ncbi:MAG: alanine racemase C-terminal domain-containing protein [bacterium]
MIIIKQVLLETIKYNLSKINNTNYLVLKSDAYGFGLITILKLIKKTNLYKFCVINIEDAITIRKKIINAEILLITPFNYDLIPLYKKYKVQVSINKLLDFKYIEYTGIKYQIAINSGMNRYGLKEINRELITKNLTGIYSHNATKEIVHIQNQVEKISKLIIDNLNLDIHYFSSSHQNMEFGNCRRIGELIYKDALKITANIVHYNYVKKGEYVGYDYSYKANEDIIVGVLDIGYADGLIRNCSGFKVYSNGKFYKLIGKSCMNNCFVLLENDNVEYVEIISENNIIENYENYFKVTKHEIYISYSLSENIYL